MTFVTARSVPTQASFENIMSTDHALGLLTQFQAVLQRDNLKADLDSKHMVRTARPLPGTAVGRDQMRG